MRIYEKNLKPKVRMGESIRRFVDSGKFVYSDRSRGFSLVEIILVIGIMVILTTIGVARYSSLKTSKSLNNMVNRIATDITYTMQRSKTQEGGLQWWTHFDNPSSGEDYYWICSGASYAAAGSGGGKTCTDGNPANKNVQKIVLPSGLSFSAPASNNWTDIIFKKSTGLPVNSSGTPITSPITITVSNGSTSKNIIIDKNGRVDY